ncbi:hypothetical protein [Burkholderia contaminans]|uniref:hypothetical protein n=1 Tax=Burkholderia contaminans TaxID=488447 RepID=UPI003D66B619
MNHPEKDMKQIESMRLARIEICPYNSARIDTGGAHLSARDDDNTPRLYRIGDQHPPCRALRRPAVRRVVGRHSTIDALVRRHRAASDD